MPTKTAVKTATKQTRRPTAAQIKAMTPKQREAQADTLVPGLAKGARQVWIDTGKSFAEQIADFRASEAAAADADGHKPEPVAKPKRAKAQPKAETKATAKPKAKPEAKKIESLPNLPVTTKEMAAAAGVTPKQLRVFLRANRETFPKAGKSYAWKSVRDNSAKKLIAASKKYFAAEAKSTAKGSK